MLGEQASAVELVVPASLEEPEVRSAFLARRRTAVEAGPGGGAGGSAAQLEHCSWRV